MVVKIAERGDYIMIGGHDPGENGNFVTGWGLIWPFSVHFGHNYVHSRNARANSQTKLINL